VAGAVLARGVNLNDFLTPSVDHQSMSRADLEQVREWAVAKLSGQQEVCGDGHQYIKLRQTVDAILGRVDSAMPHSDSSLRSASRRKTHLRLAWSNDSPELF
jgi:hypothetical protein